LRNGNEQARGYGYARRRFAELIEKIREYLYQLENSSGADLKSEMSLTSVSADLTAAAKAVNLHYVTGEGCGIVRRRRGKTFYYIGPDHKPIKNASVLARIKSLVIPPAWENVWISPLENGHIQAIGRDARHRKQYRYHARYRAVRDATKFERMLAFGAALPKIRRRVARDLRLPGLPKDKVVALIVRLLDKTSIRVGNEEYAKTNKSFGLTTLRNRHAEIHGQSLRLHFRGKSNQDHDINLTVRKLASIVKRCQDLPGQSLFQWRSKTGDVLQIDSHDVNNYIRAVAGDDFTAKDFRTWHGSGHMVRELIAIGPAETQTEINRNIAQAVKETAKHLGNRPAACRKYYIHPAVFESYTERTIFSLMQNSTHSAHAGNALKIFELHFVRLIKNYSRRRSA
jgi:DNA topoisomerase-1